ncbi:MAG: glycosyltransferase [Bacteroidales bacterium]|nr:glycosyltransferase [Bacteroidales bacterium]
MKILQLCHKMPFPLRDGGAFSIYHSALGLINQGVDLKMLVINTPKNWVDMQTVPADFRENSRLEYVAVNTRLNFLKATGNIFRHQSYFVERFWSEPWNDYLKEILTQESFDIIQLEHIYMCLYLETIRKYSKARVILRPQNVENIVWKRYIHSKTNPLKKEYLRLAAGRLLSFEMKMAAAVDGIIAISDSDARIFGSYAPHTPSTVVPIGFDFHSLSGYDMGKQYDYFPVFYHLGSMDWMPNIQGIKWFINDIIPFIIRVYPDFVFRIAGKKMPSWLFRMQNANLIVDGEVSDSLRYHEDKAVMIVPLLSGSGLRAKIVEVMALGKTVISTGIGAEGIPYTQGENILIADSGEDFARQIVKCRDSKELCRRIGENAHSLAVGHYDCNNTALQMIRFHETLIR